MTIRILAALATLTLAGCSIFEEPPPQPVAVPAVVVPHYAPECFTKSDPARPKWAERDRTRDVRRSDEERREKSNRSQAERYADTIVARRRVCEAGLKVQAAN